MYNDQTGKEVHIFPVMQRTPVYDGFQPLAGFNEAELQP